MDTYKEFKERGEMGIPTNWTEEDTSKFEAWWQARLRQLIKDQQLPSAIALFEEFELEQKLNINKL